MIIGIKTKDNYKVELIQLSENTSIVSINNPDDIGYFVLLPKGKYEYIGDNKPYDILKDSNPNFRDLAFNKILNDYGSIMENNKIDKEIEYILEETEKNLKEEYDNRPTACFKKV